jgi:hypothetical protein
VCFCGVTFVSAVNKTNLINRPENEMSKLIQAFKTDPSDKNRAKLAAYLQKHMMAICMASPDEQQFLKANGFKG